MAASLASEVALLKRPAFVGRSEETRTLRVALQRAKSGEGSAFLLEGPEGIGKTRLARWAEELARTEGFEVRWGYGVREGLIPLLPFELMFRAPRKERPAASAPASESGGPRPPIVLVEESRPRRFWSRVESTAATYSVLVATRERPESVRKNRPLLHRTRSVLWITRLEGEDHVNPASLDALADLLSEHLRSAPGASAALEGIEYLVSQGSFLPVLRLLQFLRDLAQETGGQIIVSLNPAALEPREVSLLEAESEVDAEPGPESSAAKAPETVQSPTANLLRLLSDVEDAAGRAPQLLVLDDLQWADAASVRALQFLVRNSRELPVLWLGCLREETEADGRGSAGASPSAAGPGSPEEVRAHMESEGVLQTLRLRPFAPQEVRQLLTGATEVPLDLDAGDRSFREFLGKTGGNPHFALSSLRLVWEQGRIRHQGDRAVVAAAPGTVPEEAATLPASLRRAAEERLGLLAPGERRFLAEAALIGKDFDLAPLASVEGHPVEEVRALARRLEALNGLVRPVLGGEDRWTFQDGTAWEVALSSLSPEERRAVSGAIGRWWGEHRPGDVEATARLLYASGDAEHALPWIRRAVQHALELQNPEAVERAIQWARELSPADPASVAARAQEEITTARGLRRFGANRAALRVLRALQPLELPAPVRRERELALVDVLAESDAKEAWSHLEGLEREEAESPAGEFPPVLRARMLGSRAFLHQLGAAYAEGRRAAEEALQLLESGEGDPREVSRDHFLAGWCCLELADWDDAERHFHRAQEVAKNEGFSWILAAAMAGLAAINYLLGDLRGARQYWEEGIEVERAAGELQRTLPMLINLAELAIARGDLEQARSYREEAARLSERFDLPHWRAGASRIMGDILARERQWAAAQQAFETAVSQEQKAYRKVSYWETRIGEAWVRGERGDPRGALSSLTALTAGGVEVPAQHRDYYYLVKARLLELSGSPEQARADLDNARTLTGPSPHRQARVLGDLASWESLHGTREREQELRTVADRLYASAGIDPSRARLGNEFFYREVPGSSAAAATATTGP